MRPSLECGAQVTLFAGGEPAFDPGFAGIRRLALGRGAWVEHLPGWVSGHQTLFDALWTTTRWHHQRRWMYDRVVDVPRLVASLPDDGPGHPLLGALGAALSARYGRPFDRVSLACYRDGWDSVAWHGDRVGRRTRDTVVAIVSLGSPRRFLLRPVDGGPSRAWDLGWGDLFVMGGTCQRTWRHTVPKVARAGPRISVQFRSGPDEDDEAA